MATSPLFGWEEPDDVDLVKDGAAAIRTLGNAIDTSMGDLLGGTTGQVLSKASNTNMDFTWVTSDDANAIQNTIVDAKGDLISATAADTPARLAVGTNGQVLTADSTAATGIKWATPVTESITLLSTTNLSGASTTVSSISGAYTDLRIVIEGMGNDTAAGRFSVKFNGSSTNTSAMWFESTTASTVYDGFFQTTANVTRTASNLFIMTFNLYNYAASGGGGNAARNFDGVITFYSNAVRVGNISGSTYNTIVDSITVANSGGNFNNGTIKIYGVK
jgi:hypothetical protein